MSTLLRPRRTPSAPLGRRLLATALALGVLGTTACGGGGDKEDAKPTPKPPTAADAGNELAKRLTAGDLGDFPVKSGDPAADIQEALKGMGGLRPQVVADDTIRNGAGATVNLDYTWPLSYPWTYRAKAVLAHEDGIWKLVWKTDALHPALSPETRLERKVGDSSRGGVVGAQGAVLVGPAPALMIGIDKAVVTGPEAEASARAVAELLLIDPNEYAARVAAAPDGTVVDAIGIHRNALPTGSLDKIRGAVQREMTLPVGRDPGFARSVVGTVTTATPDDAEQSQGRVAAGDVIGRSGLQGRFDEFLRGGGESKVFLAPRAAAVGTTQPKKDTIVADFQAREGASVQTTIDAAIQSAAEDVLIGANVPIAVAAVRVNDGAVLAAGESPVGRGRPDSTTGVFHPGLAGGAASALALMRSGASMNDKVTCDKSATVGGVTIDRPKSSSASGSITLAQAIARGCSPAIASEAGRVQPQTLADAATTLGLVGELDLGFTARSGAVGDTSAEGARAAALVGGEPFTASPLGLATMAASVASGRATLPWVTEALRPRHDKQLAPNEVEGLHDVMEAGRNSVSVSGAVGALEGEADGREVLVVYTKDIAYAAVVSDATKSRVSASSLVAKMNSAASSAKATSKSTSSSRR